MLGTGGDDVDDLADRHETKSDRLQHSITRTALDRTRSTKGTAGLGGVNIKTPASRFQKIGSNSQLK